MKQRRTFGCIQRIRKNVYRLRWTDAGRRKSETVYGSRVDAEKRMSEIHAVTDMKRPRMMTIREIFEQLVLPEYERNSAQATIKNILQRWNKHINPAFGDLYADELRASEIQRWLLTLAPDAAKKSLAIVRSIMKHAVMLDLIDHSPVEITFEMPKEKSKEFCKEIIHGDNIDQYYEAVKGTIVEAPFILGACAGLRPGEMLGVKVGEIKYKEGFAIIELMREVDQSGHIVLNKDGSERLKTGSSNRYVAVFEPYATRLITLQNQAKQRGDKYLSDDGSGNPIGCLTLRNKWYKLLRHNKLKIILLRNLRPTFATAMNKSGMRTEDIARLLGHTKPNITFNTYERPNADDIVNLLKAAVNT